MRSVIQKNMSAGVPFFFLRIVLVAIVLIVIFLQNTDYTPLSPFVPISGIQETRPLIKPFGVSHLGPCLAKSINLESSSRRP